MGDKIVKAQNAIELIRSGDTVCTSGFVGSGVPEEILASNAFVRLSIDHTLTHPYEPEKERHD